MFFFKIMTESGWLLLKRHPFHRYRDNTVIANSFSWDYHIRFRDTSPPKQKVAIMHKLIPSNKEEKTGEEEGGGQLQIDRAEKIR